MNTSKTRSAPARPTVLLMLAHLLERLERHPGPVGAEQYRWVVARLREELRGAAPGPDLEAILAQHPGCAELYENLNYEHAGLCRHPLDSALAAEKLARRALERMR